MEMANLVGFSTQFSYLDILSHHFSDPHIDLIIDNNSHTLCIPSCITPKGHVLYGQVIAVAVQAERPVSFTETQLQILKQELMIIVNSSPGINIVLPASCLF